MAIHNRDRQRDFAERRKANGESKVYAWLDSGAVELLDEVKQARGFKNRGQAFAAVLEDWAAMKRNQQQEERSATRRRA
jgi:hypothetical protein